MKSQDSLKFRWMADLYYSFTTTVILGTDLEGKGNQYEDSLSAARSL
jgi:hypothetical protein